MRIPYPADLGNGTVVRPETLKTWQEEAADLDLRGVAREPIPGEYWCPAGPGVCDRQEGHPGEHSTKY